MSGARARGQTPRSLLCVFDKKCWTPELKRFAANGGKVIVVAETEEKRKVAEKFAGATVVDSYDRVADEIIGQ